MELYLALFLITTILVIFKEEPLRILGGFAATLLIIMVVGLRGKQVGVDTHCYYEIFWNSSPLTYNAQGHYWANHLEPLFKLLNQCVFWGGGGPEALIFISALITVGFIAYTIYRYSPSILLSLVLFYSVFGPFMAMHNIMRQWIAGAIVFYSIKFIIQKKLVLFLITIAVAAGFHFSALVFWPIYFLSKINYKTTSLAIIWLISLAFVSKPDTALLVLEKVLFFIPKQYAWAIFDPRFNPAREDLGLVLIFKQLIFLYLLYAYNKIKVPEYKMIVLLSIIGIIFGNLFANVRYVGRANIYFSVFTILALPMAIHYTFKRYERVLASFSLYFLCTILFLRQLTADAHDIFPYRTIFN